jgi:hypothetical protein
MLAVEIAAEELAAEDPNRYFKSGHVSQKEYTVFNLKSCCENYSNSNYGVGCIG